MSEVGSVAQLALLRTLEGPYTKKNVVGFICGAQFQFLLLDTNQILVNILPRIMNEDGILHSFSGIVLFPLVLV